MSALVLRTGGAFCMGRRALAACKTLPSSAIASPVGQMLTPTEIWDLQTFQNRTDMPRSVSGLSWHKTARCCTL